jgi:shikimate dehydrogenase
MSGVAITGQSSLCLIIGDPVSHSLSPAMHNAAYAAMNLPFVMAAARVEPSALVKAIEGVRALNIRGLAVTMPHKVSLLELVDSVDETASAIGAINTVINSKGQLIGYNTDWLGILRPLERATSMQGKRVAVLGAGGAAQAALYACQRGAASATVFNRTFETACVLAKKFGYDARKLSEWEALRDFDIIINTTSLGMAESVDQSPIPPEALHAHHIVFETIYTPALTTLLKNAQAVEAKIIRGSEMFLEQGVAQFELHTGVKAPREVMENIISSALSA